MRRKEDAPEEEGEEAGDGSEDGFSEREDDFEREHNFRFEEAGAAQVTGHARHAKGSLRRRGDW